MWCVQTETNIDVRNDLREQRLIESHNGTVTDRISIFLLFNHFFFSSKHFHKNDVRLFFDQNSNLNKKSFLQCFGAAQAIGDFRYTLNFCSCVKTEHDEERNAAAKQQFEFVRTLVRHL